MKSTILNTHAHTLVALLAALFLFIGGGLFVAYLTWYGVRFFLLAGTEGMEVGDTFFGIVKPGVVSIDIDKSWEMLLLAKDLFLTILPVSAAVISFWFATRRSSGDKSTRAAQN